ncbi:MAG: hypothetical protein Kow0037_03460 [Calditrichia bacterium]
MILGYNSSFLKKVNEKQCHDTGQAMVLLALLLWFATRNSTWVLAAAALLVFNMVWPKIFYPVALLWLNLSHILGSVVSRILLTLVFYLVVTPIGILRRIMGKDSLRLGEFKESPDSVWELRDHQFGPSDLEKPY